MQAVVRAFKLQDFVAARRGARNAASVHGDFRAAGAKAHHLHWIALADFFGEFPLLLVRHSESRALMELLLDGLDDGGMAMPSHQRAKTQVVVNVLVAVNVMNPAALPVL